MRTLRLLTFLFGALALGAPGFADDGAVLGRVLVDSTGMPLPAANVTVGGATGTSDSDGRYVLFAPAGAQTIVVQAAGFASVSRPVAVAADAAVLALDVRLAPLAAPVAIDQAGGELRTGVLAVTVPAGAVSASTEFRLTALSGQGLPARLPLGWAPVLAWDVRAGAAVSGTLSAHATDLPGIELHLVRYRAEDQAWVMVQSALTPDQGQLGVDLADPGAYALVAADASPAPPIPGTGGALVGVSAVAPASGLIGSVRVEPPLASSSGGIGRAFLRLESPTALPSGTVFQVRLEDDYLVDGEPVFEEPRVQDVVLYRAQPASGSVLETVLPVRAVHSFPAERVVSGWVQVELWTRAQDAGGVLGGADAATVEAGAFRLDVAAASLPANTVLRLLVVPISPFVPASPAATPLGEVVVDLSGAVLATSAELSLAAPGLNPGDVVVIARVDTFDATPYLQVVSLAQVVNGRAVSVPHAALPGILTGGRYVFFRLAAPVGFVRGTLSTTTGPVRAVAKSTALPFAAISATNGSYTLTASVNGSVAVTGFIPHTTYQATGTVAVTAGQISTLDLVLAGAATTVTITPADGATAQPVNTMVEIVASVPFNPSTVTAPNIRLHQGTAGGPQVTVRLVLSQGNRRIAVIPDAPLSPSQLYTLVATGLRDVYGATVAVPNTGFTTRSDETPSYEIDRLTFSFPDEQGMVQVSAAPGSFPPGSHLLILNYSNQVVLTLTVDNDGAVSGTLPATFDDAMMVTLTDPDGRTLTKNVSRYVDAATGRTAVGTFGGTVEGPAGLQLRLPEGAVQKGIVFKLENVTPASIPPDKRPDLPGATLSSAVRIISEDKPTFRKEVDLVFPKPTDAPAGAFFYVYRQLQGPDGKVLNQTIDKGVVEGDRVVTASPPFSGYLDSMGGYGFSPGGQAAVWGVTNNISMLMWTFNQLLPGMADAAVFSGRVTRARWNPTTHSYEYVAVPGAMVRRVQLAPEEYDPYPSGNQSTVARSGPDGTYTFFDPVYTTGVATVRATDVANDQTLTATAYAVPKPPWAQPFRALATANFAFPPLEQPPPPPTVTIEVLVQREGRWQPAHPKDVVITGTPLALGFNPVNGTLQKVEVDGSEVPTRAGGDDYYGMAWVADYTAVEAGIRMIDAHLAPPSGPAVMRVKAFLAVAAGGGNNEPRPGPPLVLHTFPGADSVDAAPDVMPQVVFSEPVTNVVAGTNVKLVETDTGIAVSFTVSGVGLDGPIDEVEAGSIVTSLTLKPTGGLKYSTRYTLTLLGSIVDTDADGPQPLAEHVASFTTFAPGGVGQTADQYAAAGVVAMGDRAFVLQNQFLSGVVRTYDVSDPAVLVEIESARGRVSGRPIDIGGIDADAVVTGGGRLIAAGTTATSQSLPSNVHLFDALNDRMERVGMASLTRTATEGTLVRFVPRGRYLYALTQHQGVQVVDMVRARDNYNREARDPADLFKAMSDLNTDGKGFGVDAVLRTVPVKMNETTHWILADIDVGEYLVEGVRQPLALVTGQLGLGVVNTQSGAVLKQVPLVQLPNGSIRLGFGRAIAVGRLGELDVALVAGWGTVGGQPAGVLFVIDLAAPGEPRVIGAVSLSGEGGLLGTPTDVVLRDGMAIVAGPQNAVLVSLVDPEAPALAGTVPGIAGRIAEGADGVIFSTNPAVFGGEDVPGGGLHASRIDRCALLTLKPRDVEVDLTRDPLTGQMCGRPGEVVFRLCRAARVTLTVANQPATAALHRHVEGPPPNPPPSPPPSEPLVDIPLEPGEYTAVLLTGTLPTGELDPRPLVLKAVDTASGETKVENGTLRNRVVNRSVLPVGRTFVKGVDLYDGHVVRQAEDVKLRGRNASLQMTRSYSSAGSSHQGVLGAGWSWNFESRIVEGSCGLWTVITADGSSQTFRSTDGGETFTRQPGYHTKLERRGERLVFIDKSATEHFFSEQKDSGRWRLDYIEEPHHDRIVPRYDDHSGRVEEVWEVGSEDATRPLRSLKIGYRAVAGAQRIVSIVSDPLKVKVVYSYDDWGNLLSVRREDVDARESVTESYAYTVENQLDRHQLLAAVDANGARTEYQYYLPADTFPGEGGAVVVRDKDEYAKEVREFPGSGSAKTAFVYDVSEAPQARWKTTVTDARNNPTLYVLNGNGSPLRIEEPLGRVTQMTWATADIFKTQEIDAGGRVTDYDYDDNGNLKTETIRTTDFGDVITRYEYDPRFNKLKKKTDAEGRQTLYEIDPDKGDVLRVTDAEGNATRYHYDPLGRLDVITGPRGYETRLGDFDTFGQPRRSDQPEGIVQHREYDTRGRLVRESDSLGRETRYGYDGFDRITLKRRVAGHQGSDDEVATFEYFPGGQRRNVTNGKGLKTEFTLDGMNRVIATSMQGGGLPANVTVSAEYDGNGNKEYETDGRNVRRRFTYDELNRLRRIDILSGPAAAPMNEIATFAYDLVGNKTLETDVAGAPTGFAYDGLYRVKEKILPEAPYREFYTYDKVGNRKSFKDANGKTTQYQYDSLNRPTRTEDPTGHVTTATYQDVEAGAKVNKAEERDVTRGLRTTFKYDQLDREIERNVHLEGEDGVPGTPVYTTLTDYVDGEHAVVVRLQPDRVTRTVLDGLDRPVEHVVDPGGLNLKTETSFDALGNRKRTVDPGGHETVHEYDGLGRLVATRDDAGQETRVEYDGGGLKRWEQDRREVRKDFTYDNLGRLTRAALVPRSDMSGVAWSQETDYLDSEFKRIERDALGTPTTFELDGMGRVKRVIDFYGDDVSILWDGVSKREETDKRDNTTKYEYDAINRLIKVTDPTPLQAQTVQTAYDDANNRKTETDRNGIATVTQMDPMGRVLTVTRDEVLLETHTYDEAGNRLTSWDGETKKTHFVYDRANRLVSRTDGFGTAAADTTTYEYQDRCNQTQERDQRAVVLGAPFSVLRVYDGLHRLVKVTDGENLITEYGYDDEGNRTRVKEPEGQETQFAYDELGKLTRVTQPPPATGQPAPVTVYEYDAARNPIKQVDARTKSVEMTYDKLNRLDLRTQDPGGLNLITNHDYDKNGNLTQLTDPRGQIVTSTYDELNRLDTKSYAFAPNDPYRPWRHTTSIDYDYDANGNPTEIRESVASGTDPPAVFLTSRKYDDFNRLEWEITPLPDGGTRKVSYTYWNNGARKTVTDPANQVTSYTYDGQNRLETAITAAGATSYAYWPDDLLHTVTYPNGVTATHGYDKADRLTSIENTKDGTVLSSYTYTYWGNGNRKTQVEVNGGVTETTEYTYDALNHLKRVTYPADATFPAGRVVTYGYDAVGNRTSETTRKPDNTLLADKLAEFDNVNRLTLLNDLVVPAQSIAFAYDANGNQISKTVGSTVTTYRYDVRDRMVETGQGESILGRFQYDFEGRRSKKIGEDGIRQFVYDQTSLLLEYDETGAQKAKYDYGSDRLISLTRADEGRRFFSFDGLRTVTNLTSDTGSAVASYHLDAWGNFRFPSELLASKNRFSFTGYIWDQETSLFFAKARFYDPEVGRFTTQDSFLGQVDDPPSLHRYFYANANPIRYVDPTGHRNCPANRTCLQPTKEALKKAADEVAKKSAQEAAKRAAVRAVAGEAVKAVAAEKAGEVVVGGTAATSTSSTILSGTGIGLVIIGGGLAIAAAWWHEEAEAAELREAEIRAGLLTEDIRRNKAVVIAERNANGPKNDPRSPRKGTVVLPGEDAAEKAHEERRREDVRAGGAELGTAEPSRTGSRRTAASLDSMGSLEGLEPGQPIPADTEIVVVGSGGKAGNFMLRPGRDDKPIGSVTTPGKSASIAIDLSPDTEIRQMFGRPADRNDRISAAFVEDIRAAGFDVVYAPTRDNPRHVRIVPKGSQFDKDGRDLLSLAFDPLPRK